MEKEVIISLAVIGGFIIGFLWYKSMNKQNSNLNDYYKEVLTSEEYKVKGQFEE